MPRKDTCIHVVLSQSTSTKCHLSERQHTTLFVSSAFTIHYATTIVHEANMAAIVCDRNSRRNQYGSLSRNTVEKHDCWRDQLPERPSKTRRPGFELTNWSVEFHCRDTSHRHSCVQGAQRWRCPISYFGMRPRRDFPWHWSRRSLLEGPMHLQSRRKTKSLWSTN